MEAIKEILKKAREIKGFTQTELATKLGIGLRVYQNYESGLFPKYKANQIKEIDSILGTNVYPLIYEKDLHTTDDLETTLPFTPVGIPVYDVEFSLGFTDIIKNNPNVSGYITLAEFKGCDAIVRAKGESMAKYINNNDWIGIKRIYDFDVLNYGNPYGIVTKEMNMIKYLKKGKKEDTYLLKCENENYDDFEIAKNKILELYLIKTIMPILTVI
jgi:transcriptional regulator with XRE-family HTH domain